MFAVDVHIQREVGVESFDGRCDQQEGSGCDCCPGSPPAIAIVVAIAINVIIIYCHGDGRWTMDRT